MKREGETKIVGKVDKIGFLYNIIGIMNENNFPGSQWVDKFYTTY
jgi:hypothetical protein